MIWTTICIVLDNTNVTKALREYGIKYVSDILSLDDTQVEGLTYSDPSDPDNPNPAYFDL
jgi:hypothetical protein